MIDFLPEEAVKTQLKVSIPHKIQAGDRLCMLAPILLVHRIQTQHGKFVRFQLSKQNDTLLLVQRHVEREQHDERAGPDTRRSHKHSVERLLHVLAEQLDEVRVSFRA